MSAAESQSSVLRNLRVPPVAVEGLTAPVSPALKPLADELPDPPLLLVVEPLDPPPPHAASASVATATAAVPVTACVLFIEY